PKEVTTPMKRRLFISIVAGSLITLLGIALDSVGAGRFWLLLGYPGHVAIMYIWLVRGDISDFAAMGIGYPVNPVGYGLLIFGVWSLIARFRNRDYNGSQLT